MDLGVSLGGRIVLERIDLHMHCGELTALIGPNGSGKTTLLRTILGEVPFSGELQFIPFRADRRPPRVGYVPQRLEIDVLSPVSVLDLFAGALSRRPLCLGASRRIRAEAARSLALVDAADLIGERVGALSGGQLQRLLLALALTPVPEILLLDEPVAGMDRAGIERFYQTLSELRKTYDLSILLVSHDLMAAGAVADRMLFLHGGTILCDGIPREVLADGRVQRALGFDRDAGRLPVEPGKHEVHADEPGEERR
jgi:zinc transport system ATP-binding protein